MGGTDSKQRIDKWLWHARVARTRTAAADLVTRGHIRLNGERVLAASQLVRIGDAITIALPRGIRILEVAGVVDRRGSAEVAQVTFRELTPLAPPVG